MHKHKWTPWEYNNHDHDYFLDGSFRKTKYEHESYCTVCNKPRMRQFRAIAPMLVPVPDPPRQHWGL